MQANLLFLLFLALIVSANHEHHANAPNLVPKQKRDASLFSELDHELICAINKERVGLPPLKLNPKLKDLAQRQSHSMKKLDKISHFGEHGEPLPVRAQAVKYSFQFVAENVARGQKNVKEVVAAWMKSPGHRKNILNPDYIHMGSDKSGEFWSQGFGTPKVLGQEIGVQPVCSV